MKFLANENFPIASVNMLKAFDMDVTAIGLDYAGITDREVIKIATDEMRTILTSDRDYSELIFRYNMKPPAGVIYLRIKSFCLTNPGD